MGILNTLFEKGVDLLMSDKTEQIIRVGLPFYKSYMIGKANQQEKHCFKCREAVRLKFLQNHEKWCSFHAIKIDLFSCDVCEKFKKST